MNHVSWLSSCSSVDVVVAAVLHSLICFLIIAHNLVGCIKKKRQIACVVSTTSPNSRIPSATDLKPQVIPKNAKEEMIAKGELKKGKHDYPTMDDVVSDWDSEKETEKKNEKKPKDRKKKENAKQSEPNSKLEEAMVKPQKSVASKAASSDDKRSESNLKKSKLGDADAETARDVGAAKDAKGYVFAETKRKNKAAALTSFKKSVLK